MPEPEGEVALVNGSDEEFKEVVQATLKALEGLERATQAQRAREGDLLNLRFTI
jgi:hypothetical protein